MSNEKGYNGWTNFETWAVALWMDNDEGSYLYWREVAQEILVENLSEPEESTPPPEEEKQAAYCDLADRMKEEITEAAPDLGASVYADLLGAALSEVNWYEIAKNKMEEE